MSTPRYSVRTLATLYKNCRNAEATGWFGACKEAELMDWRYRKFSEESVKLWDAEERKEVKVEIGEVFELR